jgi:uncharacterized repeat protein (TIGR03803 family)
MFQKLSAMASVAAFFVVSLCLLTVLPATAQTETQLYTFSSFDRNPLTNILFDSTGNLYGGSNSGGVWELTPHPGGTWSAKTIGAVSYPVGLTFDSAGNLYITALYGRARGENSDGGIFKLSPSNSGKWTLTLIHNFNGTDGQLPQGPVVLDSSSNIFGVTMMGGKNGQGVVYELARQSNGSWKETVIHTFGSGSDGAQPFSGLIFDAEGNLYGTTAAGGTENDGTVFELVHGNNGTWTEKILHSFDLTDGGGPFAGVVFDSAGNLYGTTGGGGAYGLGTAFELSPQSGGTWTEKVLHSFGNGTDGIQPVHPLIFDSAGNLYGTTLDGGTTSCGAFYAGTAFELSPSTGGNWTETVLANFCEETGGGGGESLIFNSAGVLFGTTYSGGTNDGGTVFEINQ